MVSYPSYGLNVNNAAARDPMSAATIPKVLVVDSTLSLSASSCGMISARSFYGFKNLLSENELFFVILMELSTCRLEAFFIVLLLLSALDLRLCFGLRCHAASDI